MGPVQDDPQPNHSSVHFLQAGVLPADRMRHGVAGHGNGPIQLKTGKDVSIRVLHLHPEASPALDPGVDQEPVALLQWMCGMGY